jgi:hypothetical protein
MGKYHCTVDLLFDWFGISCMTTDNFGFYLQNRPTQTSQTGGQWYSDTSSLSIPCFYILITFVINIKYVSFINRCNVNVKNKISLGINAFYSGRQLFSYNIFFKNNEVLSPTRWQYQSQV